MFWSLFRRRFELKTRKLGALNIQMCDSYIVLQYVLANSSSSALSLCHHRQRPLLKVSRSLIKISLPGSSAAAQY